MELTKKENDKLTATWIIQMGDLVKNLDDDIDWDREDPLDIAEEMYVSGYRWVPTTIDPWGTPGYALKLVK
jgi:hypothetical protein